ncbi:MAG: DUF4263 domain-containing protein [Planctomycetia bacterium]|nr:DUF4263 domain-containing protein [Planctomycetia bacterium]
MKALEALSFDPIRCKKEVDELGALLKSKQGLEERKHLQPFFRKRRQLCAFIGSYAPDVFPADRVAFEFPLFGDFAADLVVGNSKSQSYCMVEFEDATGDSIFCKPKGKSTKEWSKRFDHGFSQLVDWFFSLSDLRNTERFARDFGLRHCRFHGFLLIGRSQFLSDEERSRLRWRAERVVVDSHAVNCLTFDDVYRDLSWRLRHYSDPSSGA